MSFLKITMLNCCHNYGENGKLEKKEEKKSIITINYNILILNSNPELAEVPECVVVKTRDKGSVLILWKRKFL